MWLPVFLAHLTVAPPTGGRLRNKLTSRNVVNFYDAFDAGFLGHASTPPTELQAGDIVTLRPVLRDSRIRGQIDKEVAARRKVTTQTAIDRHDTLLRNLGLPVPLQNVSVDHVTVGHLPVYAALLTGGQERIVAVHGGFGTVHEPLSQLLTSYVSRIREAFP